jgi:hypothetical protein
MCRAQFLNQRRKPRLQESSDFLASALRSLRASASAGSVQAELFGAPAATTKSWPAGATQQLICIAVESLTALLPEVHYLQPADSLGNYMAQEKLRSIAIDTAESPLPQQGLELLWLAFESADGLLIGRDAGGAAELLARLGLVTVSPQKHHRRLVQITSDGRVTLATRKRHRRAIMHAQNKRAVEDAIRRAPKA